MREVNVRQRAEPRQLHLCQLAAALRQGAQLDGLRVGIGGGRMGRRRREKRGRGVGVVWEGAGTISFSVAHA